MEKDETACTHYGTWREPVSGTNSLFTFGPFEDQDRKPTIEFILYSSVLPIWDSRTSLDASKL
jgi:hypothetical protein